jgi:creatinine amidohydrolase
MRTMMTTATSEDERSRAARVAVLPVGSFEQHGDFLPLITDTLIACAIAQRISSDYELFLLPPVTLSCSHEHGSFPGTVSIRVETLLAIIRDVADSLRRKGFQRLAVVNGHGGNYALANLVQESNLGERRMALFPGRMDWELARTSAGLESKGADDMHAGELEVSMLLFAYPELVGEAYRHGDWNASGRPHLLITGMQGYTPSGVIGHPSLGTAAKGEAIISSLAHSFGEHLALLQTETGYDLP